MSKPSIPKGTRDFSPVEMIRRNHIFSVLRDHFESFGFSPIETPAMENLSTLTGKYGEEGDKLIFKILNNGDFLAKADENALAEKDSKKLGFSISKKALRYDLTVPFARFVVMNQNELQFPFRRYQIQPVWRGDRPGKGRYQEFFQCDVDIIGTESLWCEVELVQITEKALDDLGISNYSIKLNNRKILAGIAELAGIKDQMMDMTIALDKLDKIGEDGVVKELEGRGISSEAVDFIKRFIHIDKEGLDQVADLLLKSETGQKGIEELKFVFKNAQKLGIAVDKLEFDVTLARGLNYYTGAIFEVVVHGAAVGSICGGGRYDDLTGIFGLQGVSGVGISFGADRIYDVMLEKDLFPGNQKTITQLMFTNFGVDEARYCMEHLNKLRERGVRCELYPDDTKMKKQMKYANDKGIPWVAVVGSREMETGVITLKNMETGHQSAVEISEILEHIQ